MNGNTTDLLTISPTVVNPSGIALKFKLTETPEELSINEDSGVISGKMIKPGDYRLVGTVSASGGEIAVTIMLHVNDTTPPTAELKSLTPVKLGENFSQKVLDNISDNSEEFTVTTNIPGVTVSPDGVLTGKLTTSGDHAGVVTVTDPSGNKVEFKVVLKVDGETPSNSKPNDGGNKPTPGGVDRPSVIPVVPDNKPTPDAKSPEKEKPGNDNLPSVSDKTPGVTPDNAVKSGATVSPSENVPTKSNGGLAGASPVKTPFFSNSDGVQLSKTGTASFTMGLASLSLVLAGGCLLFASRRRSKQVD